MNTNIYGDFPICISLPLTSLFLKKEFEEFEQQIQNLDCENRRLENKIEIFNSLNSVCECITALYSFSISKEKIDQVFSMVLSKLAKKDISRFRSADIKARLINARRPSYLK